MNQTSSSKGLEAAGEAKNGVKDAMSGVFPDILNRESSGLVWRPRKESIQTVTAVTERLEIECKWKMKEPGWTFI